MGYSNLPVSESVFTRQKLSQKTIRTSMKNSSRKKKAARHIGKQVPGPLHRINCGLRWPTKMRDQTSA